MIMIRLLDRVVIIKTLLSKLKCLKVKMIQSLNLNLHLSLVLMRVMISLKMPSSSKIILLEIPLTQKLKLWSH